MQPFIHLSGVTKTYRTSRTEHLAISDATFDVMPGELVSLVGPSGCGKSTLLKILAGLHPHDAGEVRIGSDSHTFNPSRDIGMVFQAPLLLKWRRILENVLLPAEILGLEAGRLAPGAPAASADAVATPVASRPVPARSAFADRVISRNDIVEVAYQVGGVRLTISGRAEGNAAVGQRLAVRNLQSNRVIDAVAVAPGQAAAGPAARASTQQLAAR